ncbi:MAG: hypothetical protein HY047_04120 [Acidobacteria bacterium]|nr:hypothetical protein [Acidobacteriota bacterium]
MAMLSEDDLNLEGLTEEELDRAWDLWFDLAQTTNEWDPPYTHGVFVDSQPARMPESTAAITK